MAAGGGGGTSSAAGRSLEYTPTWALAVVCFIIISVSLLIEHSIHLLTNWLKRHRKTALYEAVGRLKSELMLLGFMSLMLAVTQEPISNICINSKMADTMLPCRKRVDKATSTYQHLGSSSDHFLWMELIAAGSWAAPPHSHRLLLAEDEDDDDAAVNKTNYNPTNGDPCSAEGKVSLVTQKGLQQLQIFIFVLAVMQIVYSVLTMALGRAKMRRWKAWEKETQTTEYQVANDPNRFRFTRQTTFGKRHTITCTDTSLQLWIKCFFRQFFNSVAKVDYFTLRHGFIAAHLSARYKDFNFQKYIQRSLEEDFRVVVSVSPLMWFVVVIFMLVDVHGWHVYLWVSYIPLFVVLVLGTKLEVIVARMALQLHDQNSVIVGTPLVQPNDRFFWFSSPKFVLTLLHLTLFLNAFELAFFIWVTILFGVDSCYHEHTVIIVTRVVLAVTVQVLCSYITLPLYALVTQMGSKLRSNVLIKEQTVSVIRQWHAEVRQKRKNQQGQTPVLQSPRTSLSTDWSLSDSSSRGRRPIESYHLGLQATRGEITEEEDDVPKEAAAATSSAVRSL